MLERTSSGGFCANDTIMHITLPSLPFGGIGRLIPGNGEGGVGPPYPPPPALASPGPCTLLGERCPEPAQLGHPWVAAAPEPRSPRS